MKILDEYFETISILQIIIFPIILIFSSISVYLVFRKNIKSGLIILPIFLIVMLGIGLTLYRNYQILTSGCRICKGELDNKGRRIYLAS